LGLKSIRTEVIKKLQDGRIQHETTRSGDIDEKNLLLTGAITVEEVIELINATKGDDYSTSSHHLDKSIEVHVFRPKKSGISWYVKCYLIEPDVWFISVHK
jgi:hypothetical protein